MVYGKYLMIFFIVFSFILQLQKISSCCLAIFVQSAPWLIVKDIVA